MEFHRCFVEKAREEVEKKVTECEWKNLESQI